MSDAELVARARTEGVVETTRELEGFTRAAERSEKATDALAGGHRKASSATEQMQRQAVQAAAAQQQLAAAQGVAATATGRMTAAQLLLNRALTSMGGVLGSLRPVLVAIAGAVGAVAGVIGGALLIAIGLVTAAWIQGEKSALIYERAVTGLGRTAGLTAAQLKGMASAAADASNISQNAARDQMVAYISTGRIAGELGQQLTELGRDFQVFMGQDATEATKTLAKAMLEPAKAGQAWTNSFGLLTQAQLRQIEAMEKAGDLAGAQKILADELTQTMAGQADQLDTVAKGWNRVGVFISDAITKFTDWIHINADEDIAARERQLRSPIILPWLRDDRERELQAARDARSAAQERTRTEQEQAAANQAAQAAWERGEEAREEAARRRAAADREAAAAARARTAAAERAYQAEISASESMIESMNKQIATYGMGWEALARYNAGQQVRAMAANGWTNAEVALAQAIMTTTEAMIARRILMDGETLTNTGNRSLSPAVRLIDDDQIITPLEQAADLLREIDDIALGLGDSLSRSFGRAGQALGDVVSGITGYQAEVIRLFDEAGSNEGLRAKAFEKQSRMEIQLYGDLAGSAKQFFDEKSVGFQILTAVESAYRAFELASSIASIAAGWTEASQKVAQSGVKATASTAAGGAKMFEQLGVWAFPAIGAMVAVLAALGMRGGGGGGSSYTPPVTNDGSGTVLGDASAQSQSIGNSVDLAEKYWNRDIQINNAQLTALKAIQSGIGAVTTQIARQLGVGGGLSADGLNLGSSTVGASGLLKLFSPLLGSMLSTTRTRELAGQGLDLNSGSLGGMLSGGVSGSIYNLIQNTKTKSGFLGIGGGTTTWTTEERSGIDSQLSAELTRLLGSLRSGVLAAAGELGVTGAEATLDALTISLGRIDFAGLSSSEISEKLSAVFSAAGDQMAAAILPQLASYQRAGEGMMETLTRLATTFRAVDTTLASIGMTFGAVGLDSLAARDRLVELSGGLDAFTEGASFFAENFLTDAQRIAPIQAAVTAELTRLGVASDISRSGFASLVMGLDVSTEAGSSMFAALMRLAPALDQTLSYAEELTGVVTDLGNAADIARQRHSLELELMEAQGNSAGALAIRRADELAAMDASLRPLRELIWATNDAAEANRLATQAQEEAARAAEAAAQEAARIAETEANRLAQIAGQRRDLVIQLMELTGDAMGAENARRADLIAGLDASLQPLQRLIYAQQDYNAANAAAAQAAEEAAQAAIEREQLLAQYRAQAETDALALVEKARDALSAAYEREAGAIQTTIDKFRGFEEGLRRFRESLGLEGLSPSASLAVSKADFERTSALARVGNEQALGDLQGVSEAYLEQSRAYSKTSLDHLRNLSSVREAVQAAEATAGRQASIGEQQLAALNGSVAGLMVLNGSVLSVRDAISALAGAQAVLANATPSVANDSREWGVNPEVNRLLARQTGYSGDFGSGGWQAWIEQQDEATKAGARATLAAQGQAYRIGFATGGSFEVGGSGGTDSTPISFMATPGEMVNIRRPGDASNDNSGLVAEIRALRQEVASLRSDGARTAKASETTAKTLTQVTRGGDAMLTEAA